MRNRVSNQSNIFFGTELDLRGGPADGREHEILKLYPDCLRKSGRLWDLFNPITGERFELKKMKITPKRKVKIDLSKFVQLTEEERNIRFHVFYFDSKSGSVMDVIKTTYGEIADTFVPLPVQNAVEKIYNRLKIKRDQKRRGLYGPDLVIDLIKLRR
jgi:hypothetical protein